MPRRLTGTAHTALPTPAAFSYVRAMADSIRGTLAAGQFLDVVEALERLGIEPAPILRATGLSRAGLRNPFARFDAALEHRFWALIERVSGDPAIGLRVGVEVARHGQRRVDLYVALHAGTLRNVFRSAERFARLSDDRGHVNLIEEGALATASISRDGGYPRAHGYVDALFASALHHYDERVPGFRVLSMRLPRPRPKHAAPYLTLFRTMPSFDSTTAEITFDRGLLDVPVLGSETSLGEILAEHASELLRKVSAVDPLLNAVQSALFEGLEHGQVSLAAIARSTGTSARTLRRRLASLGTSFHEQRDLLRQELAVQGLRRGQEPVSQIGERLGFAGTNAFQRAFRRWTGLAPSTFRRRELAQEE